MIPKNILLFWVEQINLMSFHYVRDIYEKNQLAARLDKTDMIPKVNIIIGKASVSSVNGARGLGGGGGGGWQSEPSAWVLGGGVP